jgi:hypothetical protein
MTLAVCLGGLQVFVRFVYAHSWQLSLRWLATLANGLDF